MYSDLLFLIFHTESNVVVLCYCVIFVLIEFGSWGGGDGVKENLKSFVFCRKWMHRSGISVEGKLFLGKAVS